MSPHDFADVLKFYVSTLIPSGGACQVSIECSSRSCISGKCTFAKPGQACYGPADCGSGSCVNSVCVISSLGGRCNSATDCDSNVCMGTTCSPTPFATIGAPLFYFPFNVYVCNRVMMCSLINMIQYYLLLWLA